MNENESLDVAAREAPIVTLQFKPAKLRKLMAAAAPAQMAYNWNGDLRFTMPSRTHSSHYVLSIHLSISVPRPFDARLSNDDEYHDDSLIEMNFSLLSCFRFRNRSTFRKCWISGRRSMTKFGRKSSSLSATDALQRLTHARQCSPSTAPTMASMAWGEARKAPLYLD